MAQLLSSHPGFTCRFLLSSHPGFTCRFPKIRNIILWVPKTWIIVFGGSIGSPYVGQLPCLAVFPVHVLRDRTCARPAHVASTEQNSVETVTLDRFLGTSGDGLVKPDSAVGSSLMTSIACLAWLGIAGSWYVF